LFFYRSAN
jgi:polyphosphate glucokinase